MTLNELNAASAEQASNALMTCCGSSRWVMEMVSRRPFPDDQLLHENSETAWWGLGEQDWLEAFSKHPKIGEKSAAQWSKQEQSGMAQASHETRESMLRLNEAYERRFGWIFIVCATGKTADELHSILQQRIAHQPAEELHTAAAEQAKIMHRRLDKLLAE